MLHICDKVTIRGWGDRIFTIMKNTSTLVAMLYKTTVVL